MMTIVDEDFEELEDEEEFNEDLSDDLTEE